MGALEFMWPISLRLVPDTTVISRGDTLELTATVQNTTGSPVPLDGWTEVTLPNGNPYAGNPVAGPLSFVLNPGHGVTRHIAHRVPLNAPLGTYVYVGKVGTYPNQVEAECEFEFSVVAAGR